MRVLVTGGAGFIGSHVAEGFLSLGHEVAVLDNLSSGLRENIPGGARFFEADITEREDVRRVFDEFRPEVVDHHAAQIDVRKSVDDPVFDARTNILGSLNLVSESVRCGVRRFIYASTGGVMYGEPKRLPAVESDPVHPICAYGVSKHTVEHYLELYRMLHGLPCVILRYANVYGPRQNPHGEAGVNAIFIGKMLSGETPTIFGTGEQLRDYVYVADIVDANARSLERGEGEVLNIGSGVGTSVNDIYVLLARIIGFDRPARYAPARTGEIERVYLDASKAGRVLEWRPTVAFDEGLRRTVEWHRSRSA